MRLPITLFLAGVAVAAPARAAVVVDCPFSGVIGGDGPDRAFYVSPYPAASLGTVTLRFFGNTHPGSSATLEARLDTYDGTPVAPSSTRVFDLVQSQPTDVTFDFGTAPVPANSTVAFFLSSSVNVAGMDVGPCGGIVCDTPCPGVVETDGITPPLSTDRRLSMGVEITDAPEAASDLGAVAALGTLALLAL